MLLIIAIIVVVGAGLYWHKTQHERGHDPFGGSRSCSVPMTLVPAPDQKDEEDLKVSKAIVTYNDGTSETFNVDEEIDLQDDGTLIIRLADKCITISPYAYRKIVEC